MKLTPSKEYLNSIFSYDAESGTLVWKLRPNLNKNWNTRFAGRNFGSIDKHGRIAGFIDYRKYRSHRLIWKMVHDEDPEEIDHINGNPADNRLINLRAVIRKDNMRNCKRRFDNSSGKTGIDFHRASNKWRVRIGHRYCGLFESFEEACVIRESLQLEEGYHPNHGRN